MSRSVIPTTGPINTALTGLQSEIYARGDHEDAARYALLNLGFLVLVNGEFAGTLFTVTAAAWSGGSATLTIGAHGITAGQLIDLNSIVPSGYNNGGVPVNVSSVTSTQISYPLTSNPGAYTSGGQVRVGATAAVDGMVQRKSGVIYEREGGFWNPLDGLADPGSNGLLKRTSVGVTGIAVVGTDYTNTGVWPSAKVSLSGSQSIPNATATPMSFDTDSNVNGPCHSTSVNPTRLTVPAGQGGRYVLMGTLGFSSSASGQRRFQINKNGSLLAYGETVPGTSGSGGNVLAVSWCDILSAADYIEILAYQDSGGSLNAGGVTTSLSFARIG